MRRISKKDLDSLAKHLAKVMGIDFSVEWAYGAPRLMADQGSRDVSPRLPSGQLYYWMHAFYDGYSLCARQHGL